MIIQDGGVAHYLQALHWSYLTKALSLLIHDVINNLNGTVSLRWQDRANQLEYTSYIDLEIMILVLAWALPLDLKLLTDYILHTACLL